MSKFLKIPNGDYKISVQPGGTITLNTGIDSGQVVITGNLVVQGDTTTVNTASLDIEDNIILLNKGETTNAGITLQTAGIQIARGSLNDVFFVFDESINNPIGAFVLKDNAGQLKALRTNKIDTNGANLNLINSGTGVISVAGTTNYEDQVTDPDHIPNKQYVDNAILTIGDNVSVTGLSDFDTEIFIRDSERPDITDSRIRFSIDGTEVSEINGTTTILHSLTVTGTTISVGSVLSLDDFTATNMVLKHPDNSSAVVIDTTLGLRPIGSELFAPDQPIEGARIYSSTESIGGTGIYFVNEEGTRDEMVSRSRAILYGIIF